MANGDTVKNQEKEKLRNQSRNIIYTEVQADPFPKSSLKAKVLIGLGIVATSGFLITVNEVVKACKESSSKGIMDLTMAVIGAGGGFALSYFLVLGAIGLTIATAGGALLAAAAAGIGSALFAFAYNKLSDMYTFRPTDAEIKADNSKNSPTTVSNLCTEIPKYGYTFFWTDAGKLQSDAKKLVNDQRRDPGLRCE